MINVTGARQALTARDGHAILSAMTPPPRHRPFGVTLIAILFLLEALAALGLAAFLLLSPTGATAYGALFDRLEWPAALSSLLAVPPLLTAGLAGLVFRGLWSQTAWARVAALVLSFLFVLLAIAAIAFLAAFAMLDSSRMILAISGLLISGLAFLYLLRVRLDEPGALIQPHVEAMPAPAAAGMVAPSAMSPAGDSYAGYVERTPAAGPPEARPSYPSSMAPSGGSIPEPPPAVPPVPPAMVGAAGNLVPPPPRQRPVSGQGPGESQRAAAAIAYDSDTIASAPPTQQIKAGPAVAASAAIAWLIVRNGQQLGQIFSVHPGETVFLGRDPARATIVLSDPTVSGLHAQIRQEQGRCVLYDLGSTNGTFLGSEVGYTEAIQRQPLQDGDELRLGGATLVFSTSQPS